MSANFRFISLLSFILLLFSALSLILRTGTIYKVHCQITRKVYIGRTTVGVDKAMKKNKNIFDAYKRGVYKSNDTVFVVLGTGRPKRYRYPTLCF